MRTVLLQLPTKARSSKILLYRFSRSFDHENENEKNPNVMKNYVKVLNVLYAVFPAVVGYAPGWLMVLSELCVTLGCSAPAESLSPSVQRANTTSGHKQLPKVQQKLHWCEPCRMYTPLDCMCSFLSATPFLHCSSPHYQKSCISLFFTLFYTG